MDAFIFTVVALLFLAIYFLPTIVAVARKKVNEGAIFVLNLFLGWSLIGWVVALVWALSSPETTESKPRKKTLEPSNTKEKLMNSENVASDDVSSQIKSFYDLKEQGIITEEEFNQKKKSLLNLEKSNKDNQSK
tara:strand:- start:201 stop:602 length:402 start_codon:yes stop_codon:yes gene_type:complete